MRRVIVFRGHLAGLWPVADDSALTHFMCATASTWFMCTTSVHDLKRTQTHASTADEREKKKQFILTHVKFTFNTQANSRPCQCIVCQSCNVQLFRGRYIVIICHMHSRIGACMCCAIAIAISQNHWRGSKNQNSCFVMRSEIFFSSHICRTSRYDVCLYAYGSVVQRICRKRLTVRAHMDSSTHILCLRFVTMRYDICWCDLCVIFKWSF